jgi:para-nitrobenzyl esterase
MGAGAAIEPRRLVEGLPSHYIKGRGSHASRLDNAHEEPSIMKPVNRITLIPMTVMLGIATAGYASADDRVRTANGVVAGTEDNGLRVFKGIPFAQPPVGDLRWKPPQPPRDWEGVRRADKFGPRAMQLAIFGDMRFRSAGVSEDCLYLNVWTPAKSDGERLPVLVYFYGGGFVAGDGSEYRYDGASMARKGIVAVTVNYRLGLFGFLAHPELTKESLHHASGNYGLLDQTAALRWLRRNIAAFGGDARRVTIAGESAGSLSVSAQMASPLSKDLIAGAIGESGSLLGTLTPVPLAEAERTGAQFAKDVGAKSLADLRKVPAEQLLKSRAASGFGRFGVAIDGYFFPEDPVAIYAAGKQAHVPLLVGWNSEEMNYRGVLGLVKPTQENYDKALKRLYGDRADEVRRHYPAATDAEAEQAATDLAGDRFIGYSTWKWADLHGKTGDKPVYRYLFARARPGAPRGGGAVHSAEIEYALGNLATNKVYAWTADDYKVSRVMEDYFANFIKTGDPNGAGLPKWPVANGGARAQFMRLDVDSHAAPERHRGRYVLLDQLLMKKPAK